MNRLKVGAAVALGILRIAAAVLKKSPKKRKGEQFMNKQMILGGLAGGVAGAATALMFAPKPGNELLKDIYEPITRLGKPHQKKKKAAASKTKLGTSKKKPSVAMKKRAKPKKEE